MKSNFGFKINKRKKSSSPPPVKKPVYNHITGNKPVQVPVKQLSDFEKLFKNVPVTFAHNIKNA